MSPEFTLKHSSYYHPQLDSSEQSFHVIVFYTTVYTTEYPEKSLELLQSEILKNMDIVQWPDKYNDLVQGLIKDIHVLIL